MAKDLIHSIVRKALENDNWEIINDPLIIPLAEDNQAFEIDLAAEKFITAEKGKRKIAVEIKSFTHPSTLHAFHGSLGQYLDYRDALMETKMDYELFLGVSVEGFKRLSTNFFIL